MPRALYRPLTTGHPPQATSTNQHDLPVVRALVDHRVRPGEIRHRQRHVQHCAEGAVREQRQRDLPERRHRLRQEARARRDAHARQPQVSDADVQVEADLPPAGGAVHDDVAFLSHGVEQGLRRLLADGHQPDVDAGACGVGQRLRRDVLELVVVGRIGALGQRAPHLFVAAGRARHPAAQPPRDLQRRAADAGAHGLDQHALPPPCIGDRVQCVPGGQPADRDGRAFLEREPLRQGHQVAGVEQHVVRVRAACPAEHPLAGLKAGHALAQAGDHAGCLHSEDEG